MKADFLIGIDGGGSKTAGRIERLSTGESWEYRGGPSSLTNNFDVAQHEIRRVLITLLKSAHASPSDAVAVIGVAGAGNDLLKTRLARFIGIQFSAIDITTDARTALYGSRKGRPVVTLSLGTGSVAMRLDEQLNETLVGGWGFNIGDEGGGAALGRSSIRATLFELDAYRECRSETAQWVCSRIGSTRSEILSWLKEASAFDFADLVPTLFELAQHCPLAQQLWRDHARDVEKLVSLARLNCDLPIVLLGGLAPATLPLLSEEFKRHVLLPEGDALDGALLLARRLQAADATSSSVAMRAQ